MKKSDSNTLFQEQLKTLKLQYCQSFPEKIRELKSCSHGLERGQEDQFAALAHHAHKLAGSAGCYGYPEISRHAMTLWDLIDQAVSSDEITLEKTRTQISLQTGLLCKALSDHRNTAGASKLKAERN